MKMENRALPYQKPKRMRENPQTSKKKNLTTIISRSTRTSPKMAKYRWNLESLKLK